ncbi:MAG TPA: hypothetical protein VKQ36_07490, partial [Ktedonobacterales bacterium]|nr:hypothetical protein [Ktedonobacterales bacterium]
PPATPGGVQIVTPPPAPSAPSAPPAPLYAPLLQPLPGAPHASPQQLPARKIRKWPAIMLFCLFAALIPETIVTSSTNPLKMVLQPISLPFIMVFYGTADLMIREAMIRRRLGLASLLLFGIAFGFINEGVAAGTWYTVIPTGYVRYGGIDWLWALGVTTFHIVISVITPIIFIDIVFPRFAGQPLLRKRGIVICAILFFGFSLLVAFTKLYRADRLSVLAVAVALWLVALFLPPAHSFTPVALPLPGLWRLRILGFMAMLTFFFNLYITPAILAAVLKHAPHGLLATQLLGGAILLGITCYEIALGYSWSRRAGWSARHSLALITGGLAFTTLILLIFGFTVWEPIASLPFFALLVWLAWRMRHQAQSYALASAAP